MGEQQVEPVMDEGGGAILEIVDEDIFQEEAKQVQDEEKEEPPAAPPSPTATRWLPPRSDGRAPEWAKVPAGLKIPRGAVAYFVRFRAEWTDTPHKGERQVMFWANTLADEFIAAERAKVHENQTRLNYELTKQMIRAVDGHRVNWDGLPGPGSIDVWWREIGAKCRAQLVALWSKIHSFSKEDQIDFFVNCIASVATG